MAGKQRSKGVDLYKESLLAWNKLRQAATAKGGMGVVRRLEMGVSERLDERVDADSMWWMSMRVSMQADGGAEAPPAKKKSRQSRDRRASKVIRSNQGMHMS